MSVEKIKQELRKASSKEKAKILSGFFKTGPGEYGEGDVFIGVKVPEIRKVVKKYCDVPFAENRTLLTSPIHEERLCAILIMVSQFERGDAEAKKYIYSEYLRYAAYVNNWDLVDLSAHHIVGAHLRDKQRDCLYRLVQSECMWERRIAIVATFAFIRHNDFTDTLSLAKELLDDTEDLLHKATGWMLREVGKRDEAVLIGFLDVHLSRMPRTMLRYAIERFPEKKRQYYLKKK